MAIDLSGAGDVLVVAALGNSTFACFGHATPLRVQHRGVVGVVVDGLVRDTALLRLSDLPVFARGATPRDFSYPFGLDHGGVNVEVACGGVLVRAGDIIVGDDDGVVAVPLLLAEESAEAMAGQYAKIDE
jgi:4-hydroxy-4-methyl-2-oxoglutarate aldolase